MDYRHYRGDGIRIPERLRRHVHKLRPLGTILLLTGAAIPFLILIKLLRSTYFLNILAFALILLGPILYLIGLAFDTHADRSR